MASDTALRDVATDLSGVLLSLRNVKMNIREMQWPLDQFEAASKIQSNLIDARSALTEAKSLLNSMIVDKDV